MTAADAKTLDRRIPTTYDEQGEPHWKSMLSPPDSSSGICAMVPDRVIPVIFVPGIMGSNLESTQNGGPSWNMDSAAAMLSWSWKGAKTRKKYLRPEVMKVDPSGKIADGTQQQVSHLRDRGWGEVGFLSYGEFLAWLENTLNDYDDAHHHKGVRDQLIGKALGVIKGEDPLTGKEVALSYRYRFPVWACGYNWLADNATSSQRLQKRIHEAIDHYKKKKIMCDKVIIVTHSMGGLVARHCSEVLDESKNMFGIVHGVMPAIGAAAVYRRAKSGTRSSGGFFGWVTSKVLGANAADMTAVLSTSPGAMQLLPTPEYGKGWLHIKADGQNISLPKGNDPYGEIYTVKDKWWGLIAEDLMDPLNEDPKKSTRYQANMNQDWRQYVYMISQAVEPFQKNITDKYNATTYTFYANGKDHLAYGDVTWRGPEYQGHLYDGHAAEPLDATSTDTPDQGTTRTVLVPFRTAGDKSVLLQTFTISDPEEPGDGTVPERSGVAPKKHSRSVLTVDTEHEAAFRDCEPARMFTVSAIVKIAQAVQKTTLAYP